MVKKIRSRGGSDFENSCPLDNYLGIKYQLVKTENLDGYMKALGIDIVMRSIGSKLIPTLLELGRTKDGKYRLTTPSTFLNAEYEFKPGEAVLTKTFNGQPTKTTFEIVRPSSLIETQRRQNFVVTVVREFEPDGVEMVSKALTPSGKATCKMKFVPLTNISFPYDGPCC